MTRRSRRTGDLPVGDEGSGVLSTTLGVGVFLIFLLLASHVLLNLWVRSTIDSIALDAAMDVALTDETGAGLAAVEARALADARAGLGGYAKRVDLTFEHASGEGDLVVLRVRSDGLDLLPPLGESLDRLGDLDERIVVHREQRR